MALIIAHSVLFGPSMMAEPPWVLEKTYFSNLEKYEGKPVYLFEVAQSAAGKNITFVNALGETTEIETENTGGVEQGSLMFMEVVYDSSSGGLHGKLLYLPAYGEERLGASILALAGVIFYYIIWKKKLRIEWQKLKVVIKDA